MQRAKLCGGHTVAEASTDAVSHKAAHKVVGVVVGRGACSATASKTRPLQTQSKEAGDQWQHPPEMCCIVPCPRSSVPITYSGQSASKSTLSRLADPWTLTLLLLPWIKRVCALLMVLLDCACFVCHACVMFCKILQLPGAVVLGGGGGGGGGEEVFFFLHLDMHRYSFAVHCVLGLQLRLVGRQAYAGVGFTAVARHALVRHVLEQRPANGKSLSITHSNH